MKEEKVCKYCGKPGIHQFKDGTWCCSKNSTQCLVNRKKNSDKNKGRIFSIERNKNISIKLKNRKKSPEHIFNLKESQKNRKNHRIELNENNNQLCSYGCGQPAKFYFYKVKKYCCSDFYMKCKAMHQKTTDSWRDIEEISTTEICDFGCGKQARYKLKNGRYCCSSNHASCPAIRKRNSDANKIKQSGENNARFGVTVSKETKRRIRLGNQKDMIEKFGQIFPNYNKKACQLIDEYGEKHNYNFQHAENGGEYYIKELGYWVDGYDKEKNVVIECDEIHHFTSDGNLNIKDMEREGEIKEFLKCKFIRIKNFNSEQTIKF